MNKGGYMNICFETLPVYFLTENDGNLRGKPTHFVVVAKQIAMNENDIPKNDDLKVLKAKGILTDDEDDNEDIHFCKKCQEVFKSIESYLEHKVKHDNFKVIYSRCNNDKRVVLPKLIRKKNKKAVAEKPVVEDTTGAKVLKENRQKKRKRKISDIDVTHIVERSTYICNVCDKKFNREATLRWHMKYDHEAKDSEEEEEEDKEEVVEDDETEYIPPVAEEGYDEPMVENDPCHTERIQLDTKRQKLSQEELAVRPFHCETCGNRFRDAHVLKSHILTHINRRDFPCTIEGCDYKFKTKGSLKRHLRRHTGERPYECPKCHRRFTESGALTRHCKSRTSCLEKNDSDLPRYGKQWKPDQNVSSSVGAIKQVIKTEEGTSTLDLQQEVELGEIAGDSQIVGGNETIQSDLVTQTAEELVSMDNENLVGLDNLAIEIENLEPTQCRVCKEDLLSFENLIIHLRVHVADMPHRCVYCHFVAERMDELNSHMLTVHQKSIKGYEHLQNKLTNSIIAATASPEEEKKNAQIAVRQLLEIPGALSLEELPIPGADRNGYKCPACERIFRGSTYLKQHMRSHAGVKPHKCSLCEKCFITKDALTKHSAVHTEDRNYKCGECGKLFKRISHIREHLKVHSSDRPFSCEHCFKTFKTKNSRMVHLRTHSAVLPYQCRFCDRFFREKASLQRHIRMHTGERPYKCVHCGRGFSEQGTLQRHLKAKVPCTKNLYLTRKAELITEQLAEGRNQEEEPTVLAEFSSVVADTQYILPDGTEALDISGTEYVVVHADIENSETIQNLEIVTEGEIDPAILQQLTGEGCVLVNEEGQNLRIIDSESGSTISVLNQLSDKLNMQMDNEIEAVAMAPLSESDTIQQAMMEAHVVDNPVGVSNITEVQVSETETI